MGLVSPWTRSGVCRDPQHARTRLPGGGRRSAIAPHPVGAGWLPVAAAHRVQRLSAPEISPQADAHTHTTQSTQPRAHMNEHACVRARARTHAHARTHSHKRAQSPASMHSQARTHVHPRIHTRARNRKHARALQVASTHALARTSTRMRTRSRGHALTHMPIHWHT